MAAPHIAGVAALLFSAYPSLSPAEIEAVIEETGQPIFDAETGLTFPRVDAYAAVESVNAPPAIDLPEALSLQKNSGVNDNLLYLPAYASDPQTPSDQLSYALISQTNPSVVSCSIDPSLFLDCTVVAGQSGESDVTIEVSDGEFTAADTLRIYIFNNPPVITIFSPINTTYNSALIPLTVSANEPVNTWRYSLDGGPNTTFAPNITLFVADGPHFLQVFANDIDGGEGSSAISFTVDTVPPRIRITSPTNSTYATDAIGLNWSADEEVVWCAFSLNGGANDTSIMIPQGVYANELFPTTPDNRGPYGITTDGSYVWIADPFADQVFKYRMDGTFTGERFSTTPENKGPYGITTDGSYFWITDLFADKVFKYHLNGSYTGDFFPTRGNLAPYSITTDGFYFWITDDVVNNVYKYHLNGTYTGEYFTTSAGNSMPGGITTDGTAFWIVDRLIPTVFKYYLNGTYTGEAFNATANNSQPLGITHDETFFWITDGHQSVFAYHFQPVCMNTTVSAAGGPNTVTVYARDAAGNTGSEAVSFTVLREVLQIPLIQGWNLISIPFITEDTSIPSMLSSIGGKYSLLYAYHNGTWQSYNVSSPSNTLTEIDYHDGYWIYMTENATLDVGGALPDDNVLSLSPGWNLIGYPFLVERPITSVFAPIMDSIEQILAYDAFDVGNEWKSYTPDKPPFLNTLQTLAPGSGYWLKASEAVEWP